MAEIRLASPREQPQRPLVDAVLRNEIRIPTAGICRTEQQPDGFERGYGMNSRKFIERYERDQFAETPESVEWIDEYRLLERLAVRAQALEEIRFASWDQ